MIASSPFSLEVSPRYSTFSFEGDTALKPRHCTSPPPPLIYITASPIEHVISLEETRFSQGLMFRCDPFFVFMVLARF